MNQSTVIHTLVILVVIGVALWAINQIPQIDGAIKKVINVVAVVGTVLWLINVAFPGTISLG